MIFDLFCKNFRTCELPLCPLFATDEQLETYWFPECAGYPGEPCLDNHHRVSKKSTREESEDGQED